MGDKLKRIDKTYKANYNVDSYKLWWKNICYRSRTTGKPADNTVNTYASNLLSFLKFHRGSINNITLDDLFSFFAYCDKDLSSSAKNGYVIALLDYLTFLKDKRSTEFNSKMSSYNNMEDNQVIHKVDVITIDELITLRNNLKQNNKYYEILILDFMYYYGLNPDEINYCKSRNYSFEKSCFIINGKNYYMDEQVEENIMAGMNILDNSNEKDFVKAIGKMGNIFNKHFSFKSFYNLRQKHLIVCPSCNNKYVNDSRFWVLAQRQNDIFDTKVVVCRECAGKFKG